MISFSLLLLLGFGRRLFARRREVSSQKELQKECQITSVHDQGGNIVFFGQVAIGGLFDKEQVIAQDSGQNTDNHLGYLGHSDPDGLKPFRFDAGSHEKVVKVHNGVDRVVHDAKQDSGGGFVDITVPAVEQDTAY